MRPTPKPTWITLFSLCSICVAALLLIVPLFSGQPIAQAAITLIIIVGLFDVIALWLQANAEALKQDPQNGPRRKAYQHLFVRPTARKPKSTDSDHHDAA